MAAPKCGRRAPDSGNAPSEIVQRSGWLDQQDSEALARIQARRTSQRISGRAFNCLPDTEGKLALVGGHVRAGEASRAMVVDRIRASLAAAALDVEAGR